MIPLFTQLLKDFLVRQGVAARDRVSLGPPDRDFTIRLPQGQSVSVYLADVRENRQLRSNERRRVESTNGRPDQIRESPYPAWVDAHYLITAWDTSVDQNTRALKEHEIIAAISSELLAGDPFTPEQVYGPGPTEDAAKLNLWPQEFRKPGLSYEVLPPEGFPKISEFWTTMGAGSVWKPLIYLVAAVPVELKPAFEFPVVTTIRTGIGQTADASPPRLIGAKDEEARLRGEGTARDWFQIGGFVQRPLSDPAGQPVFDQQTGARILTAVPEAKVILESADLLKNPPVFLRLQETRTDTAGKYQFLFAGPVSNRPARLRVVVQRIVVKGDVPGRPIKLDDATLDVALTSTDPFPHDVVMAPV